MHFAFLLVEMSFKSDFALVFNCGFCRTFVYENIARRIPKKSKEGSNDPKPKEGDACPKEDQGACGGKTGESHKVCLSVSERFRSLFAGPQFVLGNSYFECKCGSNQSQFDRHFDKIKKAFSHGFRVVANKEKYTKGFSSKVWETLPPSQKSHHTLSNCVACAAEYDELQKLFPLKPYLCVKENIAPKDINAAVLQATGMSFAELAANQGYKSAPEVERIVHKAKKKCGREAQKDILAECNKQLESSALPSAYSTDVSFSRYGNIRRAQYFSPPRESDLPVKKRNSLQAHECDRFDALCQTLINWDPATPFVASQLAREFNLSGTDISFRIRMLARELDSPAPGLEVDPKPKSTRVRILGMPIPAPPSKKKLVEIDRSLVDSGVLKEGVPCVPVKLRRFRCGVQVEIEAHGRKFPLVEVRQSLLTAHEQFMRLHSDSEIANMSSKDILKILTLGAQYSMDQFSNATVEELRACLTKFERNRKLWVWHDHSSLASHGILAVMVGVVYDSLVFKSESEIGQSVQEYIEEGEIHMVALGSSTLADQVTLIPERLAELDSLTDEITSSSGIKIADTLQFFKGDKPAAQFEAGLTCGGNYPCVGCTCHRNRFSDFSHAVRCEQRSLEGIQEVALVGHYGRVPGKIKFFEGLDSNQLRKELERRSVKDYPKDKPGRLAALKEVLCGVQRVPSLLLFAPETTLAELHLSHYWVLLCEPLHDLKGCLGVVLTQLPSFLAPSALASSVSDYLNLLWKKSHLYGSDLRAAVVEIAHIFASSSAQGPAFDFINYLVQIGRILYGKDCDRSPKQCLQLYNCTFMLHQLHCSLFGEASLSTYFHALLIHCPVQHELVCSRSTNTESEERIFKSAEASAKCTDRKPENMLPGILKRLQCKRNDKTTDPLRSLQQEHSKISQSARKLPPYKGTVITTEFVRTRKCAFQEHLQRIGHFMVQGEGVWWHRMSDGSVQFHDSADNADISDAGPQLLHFRNADLQDVLRRSNACWKEALDKKVSLPIDAVRHYDSHGDLSAIVVTEQNSVLSETEVSFNDSFTQPVLPPPQSSTPLRQQSVREATPDPLEVTERHYATPSGECSLEGEGVQPMDTAEFMDESAQPADTEGVVDMAVDEVRETPCSVLQSTVCKAVAKLVGMSSELQEFDHVRSLCKSLGNRAAPVLVEKHKTLARHFRKQISLHKRNLESMQLSPSDAGYNKHVKDMQCCLQLICNLH